MTRHETEPVIVGVGSTEYYPRPVTLSGKGSIYSFTIVRHPVVPALQDSMPYVIAVVSLPDAGGQRLITNIVDSDPDMVHIGQEVEVVFDDAGPDATIPRFTPSVSPGPT